MDRRFRVRLVACLESETINLVARLESKLAGAQIGASVSVRLAVFGVSDIGHEGHGSQDPETHQHKYRLRNIIRNIYYPSG